MVMEKSSEDLHPIERVVVSHLQSGQAITIETLGGIEAVVAAADALEASPFQPEILRSLVDYWKTTQPTEDEHLQTAFVTLLTGGPNDFTLMETIDLLDTCRPLPGKGDEICFSSFLAKAQDLSLSAMTRGIAAEGSLRWAVSNRRWQFRLLDFLLGVSVTEVPEFVRRIAKLSGVAHSHWHESELLGKLREFSESSEAATDASFELGMASLMDGIDADSQGVAQRIL